ncbi:MAG: hypothetical protein Q8R28_05725 [Dehalococcoidia bacterium]|nr:hypothetical protein [Dehalococcoidia bacterium]
MEPGLIVAVGVGLLGAGLGLGVMIAIPLGVFNRLMVVHPKSGAAPISKSDLLQAVLRLNDKRRPWGYRPTPDDRRADLVAEWKIADARWWGAFNRNGLSRSYRAFISLNEPKRELRITEESTSVSWSMGSQGVIPSVHWNRSFFKGVILFERTKELAYGVKDELAPGVGEIYNFDFDPWRVKAPLLRLTIENGWSFCPVVQRFQLEKKSDSR